MYSLWSILADESDLRSVRRPGDEAIIKPDSVRDLDEAAAVSVDNEDSVAVIVNKIILLKRQPAAVRRPLRFSCSRVGEDAGEQLLIGEVRFHGIDTHRFLAKRGKDPFKRDEAVGFLQNRKSGHRDARCRRVV